MRLEQSKNKKIINLVNAKETFHMWNCYFLYGHFVVIKE